eukprot:TRINITY_DN1979_c0_g1_i10.p1 TRINITY_DN1979_c0_g1~~TRINITY_DN1979_c0_g1_i10.p1  ORF type:complete len:601 (+),score=81.11 TRINITY_DN1979_c0_g1_i10:25-1803(+)
MIRRPPRSTHCISSAASDVYKRQVHGVTPERNVQQEVHHKFTDWIFGEEVKSAGSIDWSLKVPSRTVLIFSGEAEKLWVKKRGSQGGEQKVSLQDLIENIFEELTFFRRTLIQFGNYTIRLCIIDNCIVRKTSFKFQVILEDITRYGYPTSVKASLQCFSEFFEQWKSSEARSQAGGGVENSALKGKMMNSIKWTRKYVCGKIIFPEDKDCAIKSKEELLAYFPARLNGWIDDRYGLRTFAEFIAREAFGGRDYGLLIGIKTCDVVYQNRYELYKEKDETVMILDIVSSASKPKEILNSTMDLNIYLVSEMEKTELIYKAGTNENMADVIKKLYSKEYLDYQAILFKAVYNEKRKKIQVGRTVGDYEKVSNFSGSGNQGIIILSNPKKRPEFGRTTDIMTTGTSERTSEKTEGEVLSPPIGGAPGVRAEEEPKEKAGKSSTAYDEEEKDDKVIMFEEVFDKIEVLPNLFVLSEDRRELAISLNAEFQRGEKRKEVQQSGKILLLMFEDVAILPDIGPSTRFTVNGAMDFLTQYRIKAITGYNTSSNECVSYTQESEGSTAHFVRIREDLKRGNVINALLFLEECGKVKNPAT